MKPRIAIPIPTSFDPEYNDRSWPQYARAVELSGGTPVPVPLDQPPADTARLAASCAAVLLPGSGADVNPQKYGHALDPRSAPADAARENVDELLLQDAHNMGKPILTICFGTQMLNVWRGGSLIQDLPDAPVPHKAGRNTLNAHAAEIPPNTLLGRLVAESEPDAPVASISLNVNSSHHQAIATPGDGLRISARSPTDNVVEAIEGIPPSESAAPGSPAWNPFILGVQWHPERTFDHSATSRALFARLVTEARAWAPRQPTAATETPQPHLVAADQTP